MQKNKAGLEEVFRIYCFVRSLPSFLSIFDELVASYQEQYPEKTTDNTNDRNMTSALQQRLLTPLREIVEKLSLYIQLVENVIDMDALPNLEVNAVHDTVLMELREEKEQLEEQAERLLRQAKDSWASFADVKVEKHPQHGIIFRTTKGDDERELRARNKDVKILSILKVCV